MMRALLLLLAAAFAGAPSDPAQDPALEIVRRSAVLDNNNFERAHNYTFLERVQETELDAQNRKKSTESHTFDVTFLFGVPYHRLIAKNDQPLPAAEEKKQEAKLTKLFAARQKESEAQRKKRLDEYLKRRERNHAFLREVLDAFDFRLLGEESVQGRPAYVIEATPKPAYRPRTPEAKVFPRLHGKLWVDKVEFQWLKGEAEATDTISFGLFLARLGKGSRLQFEQTKVNDEVWLPRRIYYEGSMRLVLVKKLQGQGEITYSDYKKFQSDAEIVVTGAAPAQP